MLTATPRRRVKTPHRQTLSHYKNHTDSKTSKSPPFIPTNPLHALKNFRISPSRQTRHFFVSSPTKKKTQHLDTSQTEKPSSPIRNIKQKRTLKKPTKLFKSTCSRYEKKAHGREQAREPHTNSAKKNREDGHDLDFQHIYRVQLSVSPSKPAVNMNGPRIKRPRIHALPR